MPDGTGSVSISAWIGCFHAHPVRADVYATTRRRAQSHHFFVMGTEMVLLEKKNVFDTITGVLGKMATSQVKRKDSVPSKGWLRFSEV